MAVVEASRRHGRIPATGATNEMQIETTRCERYLFAIPGSGHTSMDSVT